MDEKIVKDSQGLAKDLVNDCISRQAAIDALGERPMLWVESDYELGARNQYDADVLALETVPSAQPSSSRGHEKDAQPERKQGHWIESHEHVYMCNEVKEWTNWYCSECDAPNSWPTDFCPYCGADMREVDDERHD